MCEHLRSCRLVALPTFQLYYSINKFLKPQALHRVQTRIGASHHEDTKRGQQEEGEGFLILILCSPSLSLFVYLIGAMSSPVLSVLGVQCQRSIFSTSFVSSYFQTRRSLISALSLSPLSNYPSSHLGSLSPRSDSVSAVSLSPLVPSRRVESSHSVDDLIHFMERKEEKEKRKAKVLLEVFFKSTTLS